MARRKPKPEEFSFGSALTESELAGLMQQPTYRALQDFEVLVKPRYLAWLREYKWLRETPSDGQSKPTPQELEFVRSLWDQWKSICNKPHAPANPGTGRTDKALALYRKGHTLEELLLVVRWAAQDDWMNGRSPGSRGFLEFKTLFGPENFDRYLLRAQEWERGRGDSLTAGVPRPGRRL